MGTLVFFFFYGSILFFVVAVIIQTVRTVRAPVHLPWDLYKTSSVYELTDWWTKAHSSYVGKLYSVAMDILTLREFYHRNRRFWYPLFIFHIGLYSLCLWHVWLFVRAVVMNVETASVYGWVWGTCSTLLTFMGATAILWMRTTDEELRIYYPCIHYLKWVFVLLTLLGGVYAVDVHFGSKMPVLLRYVRDQVTFADFEHKLHPAFGPALHIAFAAAWLIYLPFSHVFEVFFRYYHYLRWDEVPNTQGSKIEQRIAEQLERPITWSGAHIPSDKRWKEVASELHQTPRSGT